MRPWALSAPVVVLLICLPLLRPLWHPLVSEMSDDEQARWATIAAIVETQSFAIDQTPFAQTRQKIQVGDAWYSDQPPVMGLLLAGPYWLIHRAGYTFANNPSLVEYLLTLFGVTLPVAAAAGMLYRMSRLFELKRPWRAGLALAVVMGSGLLAYATVLNPYAPAAALVLLASAILVQVSLIRSPLRSGGYLISAGFFAALAATIDPAAVVFTLLLIGVIIMMRWRWSARIGGVLMYGIGMLPPVLLHLTLCMPITGNWQLGLARLPLQHHLVTPRDHGYDAPPSNAVSPSVPATVADADASDDQPLVYDQSSWQRFGVLLGRFFSALLGAHGIFTHYPVLIFGLAGLQIVMHRHWPTTTKGLAIMTIAGSAIIVLRYAAMPLNWKWAMFGVRWFVVFMPLTLFWAGAWLRRNHHLATWITAGVLLAFSVFASVMGATDPMPREGYDRYSVAGAVHNLISPAPESPVLAGSFFETHRR